MAELSGDDLSGSRFERVRFDRSTFVRCDLSGARWRSVDLSGMVITGADLIDVDVSGEIDGLMINGVDVGPLIEAELDRRHPERRLMRPTDAAGFRVAWAALERLWDETVERARQLDPDQLHVSVREEWTFIETLRHLVFATDSWVVRAILGEPTPWHPLSLPWDEMPDLPGVPRDRTARPSLDTVLALRRDRMARVRSVLEDLDDETLAGDTTPVEAPGWPLNRAYPVRECLKILLNEEWEHRVYAERDLAVLGATR